MPRSGSPDRTSRQHWYGHSLNSYAFACRHASPEVLTWLDNHSIFALPYRCAASAESGKARASRGPLQPQQSASAQVMPNIRNMGQGETKNTAEIPRDKHELTDCQSHAFSKPLGQTLSTHAPLRLAFWRSTGAYSNAARCLGTLYRRRRAPLRLPTHAAFYRERQGDLF
eukprot:8354221-Pyramimonas_sp.AAC.1